MGRRGPPPEPTVLKLLKGNPGKRAINHDEPKLAPASADPPKGLKGRALVIWRDLAADLVSCGLLKASDRAVFRVYCELVGECEALKKKVDRVGAGEATRLGYPRQLHNARKQLKEYAGILGLSPSARSAIRVTPEAPKDDEEEFFSGPSRQVG